MSSCDHCGAQAFLQIRAVEPLHLCETCADRWSRRMIGVPLGRWYRLLMGAPQILERCPFCGCARKAIQETGFYGCAVCYEIFAPGML